MVDLCTLTGIMKRPDGTPFGLGQLVLVPDPPVVVAVGTAVSVPTRTVVNTGADGVTVIALRPGNYKGRGIAPGERFDFTLGVPDVVSDDLELWLGHGVEAYTPDTLTGKTLIDAVANTPAENANGTQVATAAYVGKARPHMTPKMFDAPWSYFNESPTIDASAEIAALLTQAQVERRPIEFDARRYLLRSTPMPRIDVPIGIYGQREGTVLQMHPDYRGPVLFVNDTIGLAASPTDRGGMTIDGITILGRRRKDPVGAEIVGELLPWGSQHGLVFTGRIDRASVRHFVAQSIRGWGVGSAYGGSVSAHDIREANWYDVRIRNCGARTEFPAFEIRSPEGVNDPTNNFHIFGLAVTDCPATHVKFWSMDRLKEAGHIHVLGFMTHGQGTGTNDNNYDDPEDYLPGPNAALIEIDGEIGPLTLRAIGANGAATNQYIVGINNTRLREVTLATNSAVTTNGSADVQITLPAQATLALVTAQCQTVMGRPMIGFTWPDDAPSPRPVVGQEVTLDIFSGGVRTERQINVNGVIFNSRNQRVEAVEGDVIWCFGSSGFPTAAGVSGTPINQTLSVTYGIDETITTCRFDARVGDVTTPTTHAVGGITLTGVRTVKNQLDHNVFVATFGTVATSSATSAFGSAPVLALNTARLGPGQIKLEGYQTSGTKGVYVNGGQNIDIDFSSGGPVIDVTVTDKIIGPVRVRSFGREGPLALNTDPATAHLVTSDISGALTVTSLGFAGDGSLLGLGGQTADISADAADLPTRFARFSADAGTPDGGRWHGLHLSRVEDGQGAQWAVKEAGGSVLAVRNRSAGAPGTWSAWNTLFGRTNLLGPVSQLAGVPTGSALEVNANANGSWERTAGGWQRCVRTNLNAANSNTADGAAFRSADITWTFPAGFDAGVVPAVSILGTHASFLGARIISLSNTAVTFQILTTASVAGAISLNLGAQGRWSVMA